ncbi:MAG: glycosyltransferase family 4 protein [Candidatus Omnitrophica bacterium]|nr:glycosyltransferase family 4 protein [Candidatus Omnitrophota bacterium]MCB9746957.1 glycosyltransferase family 4 protein [Candidatus Omnitrophota bacterium]
MNILYHHRTHGTGAEGVHIAYIIKGLRDLGHKVDVISPNNIDPTLTAGNNPFAADGKHKKNRFLLLSRKLPQIFFEWMEIGYNFVLFFKLWHQLKKESYQLIYERQAFFCFVGALKAKKCNVPFIVEVNEVAGEKRVRKQICVGLAKRIEKYVFSKADAIIVVSEFLKKKIIELGIPSDKIHVIPNGVDEQLFNPQINAKSVREKYNISEDMVVIGFIGWFVQWHQLDRLIDVFAQLASTRDIRLMLVGDGDLKESLAQVAKEKGMLDKLIFSGAIKYQSIPAYIQAMDICVIPASNEYRSPIKLFEYMAMAKPTVAPRFQAIESVVGENEYGLLFNGEEAEDLKNKLEELIENKQRRQELGMKARQHIEQNFLWRHNAEKVLNIYKNI